MQQLMVSVEWISAHVGIASNNHTLKLAVFHTIFNLIGVIIMIPFIGKLVVFLEKTLKSEPAKKEKVKIQLDILMIRYWHFLRLP